MTKRRSSRLRSSDVADPTHRSPLHSRHEELGARFADFAGWSMPLHYEGVVAEHQAVRRGVGIFDVSHLGTVEVTGPGAETLVDTLLTNDLRKISPGQAQYTLCCTPEGGVVDDLIVYRRGVDDLVLVPNAANSAAVLARLRAAADPETSIVDRHQDVAILAVQGPRSDELLAQVGLPTGHPYMSFVVAHWSTADLLDGATVMVCRTGYTGERGYELMVAATAAGPLWDALLATSAATGATPCGLGARDTLRTEMGYPLHGQDLSTDVSPVQARLAWAVGWDKKYFVGCEALAAERSAGPVRRLVGIQAAGRGIPRPGMPVLEGGTSVGGVTSGTFSPTLRQGIGLALIDTTVPFGATVMVDVRGREEDFRVVKPPFVTTSAASGE